MRTAVPPAAPPRPARTHPQLVWDCLFVQASLAYTGTNAHIWELCPYPTPADPPGWGMVTQLPSWKQSGSGLLAITTDLVEAETSIQKEGCPVVCVMFGIMSGRRRCPQHSETKDVGHGGPELRQEAQQDRRPSHHVKRGPHDTRSQSTVPTYRCCTACLLPRWSLVRKHGHLVFPSR